MHRKEILVPVTFLLLAAALRLTLFSGLYGHDDWVYLFYIRNFFNDNNYELLHSMWGIRFGMWGPIALSLKVFGVSYWSALLPPFLYGLAAVPLAYASIRTLGLSIGAAAVGCAALVLNPIDWMVSSTIRGDIEMSFYGGALLLTLLLFRQAVGARRLILGATAGLIWGFSAITKEWGFIFAWGIFLVALTDMIFERRFPWEYAIVGLGFFTVMLVDAAVLKHLTGDWLARFHTSIVWFKVQADKGEGVGDVSTSFRYLPQVFLGLRTETTGFGPYPNHYPYYGPYMWLLIASLPFCFFAGNRGRPAACFVLGVLLWIEFGSMNWQAYLPYHKEPRYFALISVPTATVIAFAGEWILAARSRILKGVIAGLMAVMAIMLVRVAMANHREYVDGRDYMPAVVDWLQHHHDAHLWVDASTQNELDLRFAYAFADPVHQHAGRPGFGTLADINFWDRAQPGDFLLVHTIWPAFQGNFPMVDRRRLKLVTMLPAPESTPMIYQLKPRRAEETSHYLSDDNPLRATQSLGAPPQWDQSIVGKPIRLQGVTYRRGIGTHAISEITFSLGGHYKWFTADVGLDDNAHGQPGSVIFSVYTDGQLRHQTPVMLWGTPIEKLKIDVTGVTELKLAVGDAGDGVGWDQADWADAAVLDGRTELPR
jgi:hypothetical protein